ncbi:MAG: PqqD family protein [Rhodospirillales bacterium]|nr:PqqD family protein [Rhodospirillales bacterium]
MTQRYLRNSEATERAIDGVAFLALPGQGGIFQLNATGTALWRLLEDPISASEAAHILHTAFPDIPRSNIESDVETLLSNLKRAGLVSVVD